MKSVCTTLFLALLAGCLGCFSSYSGPPLGEVTGIVEVNGKPVEGVIVAFTPIEGGRGSTGTTDASGNFRLIYSTTQTGAEVGRHYVQVSSDSLIDPDNVNTRKPTSTIPAEIAAQTREVEVESGSNTIDLKYP